MPIIIMEHMQLRVGSGEGTRGGRRMAVADSMRLAQVEVDADVHAPSVAERVVSIDVLRGLTMLVMLFVNDIGQPDLGNVTHAPSWLYHIDPVFDGMTLPDVIFPTFLFLVGLSIPLALERRLARGDSLVVIVGHVLIRAAGLVFIGLCMGNMDGIDAAATGMSGPLWRLLTLTSIVVLWLGEPPPGVRKPARWCSASWRRRR